MISFRIKPSCRDESRAHEEGSLELKGRTSRGRRVHERVKACGGRTASVVVWGRFTKKGDEKWRSGGRGVAKEEKEEEDEGGK